jgi:hypothetical protein
MLAHEIRKYMSRGLEGPGSEEMERLRQGNAGFALYSGSGLRTSHDADYATIAYWEITVLQADEWHMLRCSFKVRAVAPGEKQTLKTSEPCLLYPCDMSMSPAQLACTYGTSHWMMKAFYSHAGIVAIRGIGAFNSAWIKPSLFLAYKDSTCTELVHALRSDFGPPKEFGSKGIERYHVGCSVPATYLERMVDWRVPPAEQNCCTPNWRIVLASHQLRTHTICTAPWRCCSRCD